MVTEVERPKQKVADGLKQAQAMLTGTLGLLVPHAAYVRTRCSPGPRETHLERCLELRTGSVPSKTRCTI